MRRPNIEAAGERSMLGYVALTGRKGRKEALEQTEVMGLKLVRALVPGAGIYYTAYYFIMGDNAMALSKGIETIKIAVAIALAIVFVFSMPNPVAAALRRRK